MQRFTAKLQAPFGISAATALSGYNSVDLLMTRLVPTREKERLAALQELAIVGSEPEPQFDIICRFACNFFKVPIAYIAFIDEGRQWLKAACGMSPTSVPRAGTFCSRTILLNRVLVVRDALADPRFADNPYVVGAPHICFYAGAPLTLTQGMHVGTLCLIDTAPREFQAQEVEALSDLAGYVVRRLQTRAKQREAAPNAVAGNPDDIGGPAAYSASTTLQNSQI